MRCLSLLIVVSAALAGCRKSDPVDAAASRTYVPYGHAVATPGAAPQPVDMPTAATAEPAAANGVTPDGFVGFDRNDYPGDATMAAMKKSLAFTGFWVTPPPGETANTWKGKRTLLKQQGWGFLVLANGRFDKEILAAQKRGTEPADLGRRDAAKAIASAKAEGFPAHTILFLDQEEGGRLLDEQAQYLLAWTEAVSTSGFKAGVYASGQLVQDDPGVWIDTVRDIRQRIKASQQGSDATATATAEPTVQPGAGPASSASATQPLHDVAIFDTQDACPPAPGCTLRAKPLSEAGEPNLTAWQYSQSPRRPEITQACAKTYAADNNCYVSGFPKIFLDMDVASSADPSNGR